MRAEGAKNNFRIFVRAIIWNGNREILMLRKNQYQSIAPGEWLLPGGAVEFSEIAEQALIRELKEEVNFTVQSLSLLGTNTMLIDNIHWQGLYYAAEGDLKQIINNEPLKHLELKWFDRESAQAHMSHIENIPI